MRSTLESLVGRDAAEAICPPAKMTASGDEISYGFDGISDPMLRRQAMAAVYSATMERNHGDENGPAHEKARLVLGQAGFVLSAMSSEQ